MSWEIIQGLWTLHNPFGSRKIDVAHDTIASGIRRLGTALMEGKSHPPVAVVGSIEAAEPEGSGNKSIQAA